jgi:hypothetical protein
VSSSTPQIFGKFRCSTNLQQQVTNHFSPEGSLLSLTRHLHTYSDAKMLYEAAVLMCNVLASHMQIQIPPKPRWRQHMAIYITPPSHPESPRLTTPETQHPASVRGTTFAKCHSLDNRPAREFGEPTFTFCHDSFIQRAQPCIEDAFLRSSEEFCWLMCLRSFWWWFSCDCGLAQVMHKKGSFTG